jgi:hypothetical protein
MPFRSNLSLKRILLNRDLQPSIHVAENQGQSFGQMKVVGQQRSQHLDFFLFEFHGSIPSLMSFNDN